MKITPKLVNKPWGWELWIADGNRTPYASKKIFFKAGNRTSLQAHQKKFETNYVESGTGFLEISEDYFNVELFSKGNMTQDEIDKHIAALKVIHLEPGVIFDVIPGHLHRVNATTDLTFMETSTRQLDDVVRIQDDTKRPHGKIDSEHN
jgi:mannose-1-phosphate guanylyltransferase